MKKRVGVARALIAKPPYLLLDEPSAGLDPVSTRTVNELIARLRDEEGFTALVSSYDFEAIRDIVDNVLLLDGGTAVFCGTPQEIDTSNDKTVRHFIDGIEVEAV
jgi:ABC-type transporter Mla maintaining outer membrane lipid asymmetry ATPase subunit MlaF